MDITMAFSCVLTLMGLGVIIKGYGLVRTASKLDEKDTVVPKDEQVKAAKHGAMLFYVMGGVLVLAPLFFWLMR